MSIFSTSLAAKINANLPFTSQTIGPFKILDVTCVYYYLVSQLTVNCQTSHVGCLLDIPDLAGGDNSSL